MTNNQRWAIWIMVAGVGLLAAAFVGGPVLFAVAYVIGLVVARVGFLAAGVGVLTAIDRDYQMPESQRKLAFGDWVRECRELDRQRHSQCREFHNS